MLKNKPVPETKLVVNKSNFIPVKAKKLVSQSETKINLIANIRMKLSKLGRRPL